jgi:hypothetical protein
VQGGAWVEQVAEESKGELAEVPFLK